MVRSGTVTFNGKSGRYAFTVHSFDTSFIAVGAVYFITRRHKKTNNGQKHIRIYVGETRDLSERFADHHKKDCFDEHKANCICVYREDSESKRLKIEKDLKDNYIPPCND